MECEIFRVLLKHGKWSFICAFSICITVPLNKWKQFSRQFPLSLLRLFFSFCLHFCLLSHFEIIRCIVKSLIATSMYFFSWNKTEKKLTKYFLGTSLGAQTGNPVYQTIWICPWLLDVAPGRFPTKVVQTCNLLLLLSLNLSPRKCSCHEHD